MHRFEVYTDNADELRWRLRADNHQTIAASSEGYRSRQALERSIEIVREATSADVYLDQAGQWRWRIKADNGNIICTGGEGYRAQADCQHGLERTLSLAHSAEVVELETA